MPIWLKRPSHEVLDRWLARRWSRSAPYPEVGATSGQLPAGYHHLKLSVALGRQPEDWVRAKEALKGWERRRSRANNPSRPSYTPLSALQQAR